MREKFSKTFEVLKERYITKSKNVASKNVLEACGIMILPTKSTN
jgi:hypothetical protein